MPEKQTVENARRAKREGKAPSTQAGEFVREEVHSHQGRQLWRSIVVQSENQSPNRA